MAKRLMFVAILLALLPFGAIAAPGQSHNPQTAACYAAAIQALTKQGSIYSQGGNNILDPIDAATGAAFPRTGPNSFDCSGLVWWAYAQAGVSVGSTTYSQVNNGFPISCTLADLVGENTTCWALGDLIFLNYTGGQHVAIYVGSGLFMDCYNYAVGCILHNVATDSFYQSHFAQARRIVSGCEDELYNPGAPTVPAVINPTLEDMPDIAGYVAFVIPQCGACNGEANNIDLHEEPYPELGLDPLYPFKWLAAAIKNLLVWLICWLLQIAQIAATIASQIANTFIYVFNQIWKFLVLSYITARSWLYALWIVLEQSRDFFHAMEELALVIQLYIELSVSMLIEILDMAGQLVLLLLYLSLSVLNIVGYVGGLALSFISSILGAISGSTIPPQINTTDEVVYKMVRGTLEGMLDSQIGWIMYLLIGMAYIGFVAWLSRYLPGGISE